MTYNDLKLLFLGYCHKESSAPDKKLIGMEYENFVLIPEKDSIEDSYLPLSVEGDSGVFSVLENLVMLTKNTADPLERIYEKEMLLALPSPSGSKFTIEPGGQTELLDAPRYSLL